MVESADTATVSPGVDTGKTESGQEQNRGLRAIIDRYLDGLAALLRRYRTSILVTLLFFVIGLIALAPQIFITVPSGHVGVLWYRFFGGTVTDHTYGEGIHMIFPWDEMYIYDARLQNQSRVYDTISSNGLSMKVDIAVRYRINRDNAGNLHKLVGPRYPEVLVYPEIGSHARELISRYTPEQLYTETRAFIQAEILERMVNQLGSSLVNQSFQGKLVIVEDVLIRSVTLPERVSAAIERKAEQYQSMLEYDFRLAREEKEKQRKKIEAEGIREFQDIVAKTITPEYLRLRGIEATMALATSKNSKTIIIGGKDGLPVILNTADNNISDDGNKPEKDQGSSADLTGDTMNTLPSGQQFNARMPDISPQNAISPGITSTEAPAAPVDGMPNGNQTSQKTATLSSAAAPGNNPVGPDGEPQPTAQADPTGAPETPGTKEAPRK